MKMLAVARLFGQANPYFKMETPSDFCALCRLVETVNITTGGIFPGETQAVTRELRDARDRFPKSHYEADNRLANAVERLKGLDTISAPAN